MEWKIALIGLVLMFSLVFAFTPGLSEQEKKYWDTTSPPKATVSIEYQNTPFKVTITSWDENSLKGTATLEFLVYSPAGIKSCIIQSKTTHLSYFSDPKIWATYKGTCETENSTFDIPGVGTAKMVKCEGVNVGEGITEFNVTCVNKAGQKSTASSKFIIDKMKPYVDPNSIQVDNWGPAVLPDQNAKTRPQISFTVYDLSGLAGCIANVKLLLKDNEGNQEIWKAVCTISSESGEFGEIKQFQVICQNSSFEPVRPEFIAFGPKEATTIECTDIVGNNVNSTIEDALDIRLSSATTNINDLPDIVYTACKFAREYTTNTTLENKGYFSITGGDSPEMDSAGIVTFVYLEGQNNLDPQEVVKKANKLIANDDNMKISRVECAGAVAGCATIEGAILAAEIGTAGVAAPELEAVKYKAQNTLRGSIEAWFKSLAKRTWIRLKSWFKEGGGIFRTKWSYEINKMVSKDFTRESAWALYRLMGGSRIGITRSILVGNIIKGALSASLRYASAISTGRLSEFYENEFDYNAVSNTPYTENEAWVYAVGGFAAGFLPFGQTAWLVGETTIADIPDVNLFAPSSIEPGKTYMVTARIQQVNPAWTATGNDLADKIVGSIGGCFMGCPQYVCTVTVVPSKMEPVETS